jgi:hypothetical protein
MDKEQTIKRWMRKTRGELASMARQERIHTDDTMSKQRVCELLWKQLTKKVREAQGAAVLEQKKKEVEKVKTETTIPEQETNLHPMKKPASYTVLVNNKQVYGGILAEKANAQKGTVMVVTGSGQKWEFPL